jgi:5-enolpyruvylshikimate-3-phosphate synthase
MATCNGMPTSSKKQKTTTKKSLLISSEVTNQGKQGHSSLEHIEVQVDLSSASFMLTLCLLLVQVL